MVDRLSLAKASPVRNIAAGFVRALCAIWKITSQACTDPLALIHDLVPIGSLSHPPSFLLSTLGLSPESRARVQADFCTSAENRNDPTRNKRQATVEDPSDSEWSKHGFPNNVIVMIDDTNTTFTHLLIDERRSTAK